MVTGKFCPCGYYYYSNSCYWSSDNDETLQAPEPKLYFANAKRNCQSQGGHLVTFEDDDELHFVVDVVRK